MLQPPTKFEDRRRHTFGFSINRPGDTLIFDLLTSNLVPVAHLPTNFDVSGTLRSRLMGQQLSDGPRDLATLSFDLGDHGACR